MSINDWEVLNEVISLTGEPIARLVRHALKSMIKSKHFRLIKNDKRQMYSGLPHPGRKVFFDDKYDAKRLQIPLTTNDKNIIELAKAESSIGKAALIREAIHWYSAENKARLQQAKKMFNLPAKEEVCAS